MVITGGNRGIGLAMAQAVADAGARVVIWGRDPAKNASALAELAARGASAHAFECDVSDPAQVEAAFVASLDAAGGRVDTVFANAGISGDGRGFLDMDLDEWRRVLRTNLDGAFSTLHVAARHMVATGGGGALVVVSSTSAIHGAGHNVAYGTSKTALLGLTRALAVGLAQHGIRVNALVPGWTRTDLTAAGWEWTRFREATLARTPVRRWAAPEDMGPAAVFLADPTYTFHTGDALVVDGGYTIF